METFTLFAKAALAIKNSFKSKKKDHDVIN